MPISPTASYRLVYAQAPFSPHTSFLEGLRVRFPTLEIPYLDAANLSEEAREAVDQYLYVLNDSRAGETVAAIKAAASRGRAFPGRLEDLGIVPGRDVAVMLERFRIEQEGTTDVGAFYQIQSGRYRNLIVQVTDKDASRYGGSDVGELEKPPEGTAPVVVEYPLFGRRHSIVVDKSNLAPRRALVEPEAAFTNYLLSARRRKAVILDADTELREACCRCDNLYARADPEEVAQALKEGREPPLRGRYVGGAQGFYFTISRFRLYYAEYELHVVFDEREGGPRAGQGSDTFRTAYMENRSWVKQFVRACGLHMYELPGARSEDMIGSLVSRMEGDLGYSDVLIATKGSDFFPLASEITSLTLPKINFRDHPQTITVREALQKFGLSDAGQLPRIYWLRALTGDVAGTPSVNLFNKEVGHRYTNIRQADYLPHVLSAADLTDLKLRLLAFEAFHPFILHGQFDRNLAALSLDTTLLDGYLDFGSFRITDANGVGKVDSETIRALLEENSFHKEVEYMEWSMRVISGLW